MMLRVLIKMPIVHVSVTTDVTTDITISIITNTARPGLMIVGHVRGQRVNMFGDGNHERGRDW